MAISKEAQEITDAPGHSYRLCPFCGSTDIERASYPVSRGWICRRCAFVFEEETEAQGLCILFAKSFRSFAPIGIEWRKRNEFELERER